MATYEDLSKLNKSEKALLSIFEYEKNLSLSEMDQYFYSESGFSGYRITLDLSEKGSSLSFKIEDVEFDENATTPPDLESGKYFVYKRYFWIKKSAFLTGEEVNLVIKKYISNTYFQVKSEITSGETIVCDSIISNVSSNKNGIKVVEIGTTLTTSLTLSLINTNFALKKYSKVLNKNCKVYSIINPNDFDYSTIYKIFEGSILSRDFYSESAQIKIENKDIYKTQKSQDSDNKDLMIFGRLDKLNVDDKRKNENYIDTGVTVTLGWQIADFGNPFEQRKVASIFMDDITSVEIVKYVKSGDKICLVNTDGKEFFCNVGENELSTFFEEFATDLVIDDFDTQFPGWTATLKLDQEAYNRNFNIFEVSSTTQYDSDNDYIEVESGESSASYIDNQIPFNKDMSFLRPGDVISLYYYPSFSQWTPSIPVDQEFVVRSVSNNVVYFDTNLSAQWQSIDSDLTMYIPRIQQVNGKKKERRKIQLLNLDIANIRTTGNCSYFIVKTNSINHNIIFYKTGMTTPSFPGNDIVVNIDSVTNNEGLAYELLTSISFYREDFIISLQAGSEYNYTLQFCDDNTPVRELSYNNFLSPITTFSMLYLNGTENFYDFWYDNDGINIQLDPKKMYKNEMQFVSYLFANTICERGSNTSYGTDPLKNKRRILIKTPLAYQPEVGAFLRLSTDYSKTYKILEVGTVTNFIAIYVDEEVPYSTSAVGLQFTRVFQDIDELEVYLINTLPHYSDIAKQLSQYLNIQNIDESSLDEIETNDNKLFLGFAEKTKEQYAKILNKMNSSICAYSYIEDNLLKFKQFSFTNLQSQTSVMTIRPEMLMNDNVAFSFQNSDQFKDLFFKYNYSFKNESFNNSIHLTSGLSIGEKKEIDTVFVGDESTATNIANNIKELYFNELFELTLVTDLLFLNLKLLDIVELQGFNSAPNQKYVVGSIETNGMQSTIKIYSIID